MDHDPLDAALARMAPPLPASLVDETGRMARASGPRARRRSRWLLAAALMGTAALTAGASVTAASLQAWPFVGLPDGSLRTQERIPLDWTTDSGEAMRCAAWIELADSPATDVEALDAAIRARDWTTVGQRLYDGSTPLDSGGVDPGGQQAVADALRPALDALVRETLPRTSLLGAGAVDGPRVGATGFRCDPDAP